MLKIVKASGIVAVLGCYEEVSARMDAGVEPASLVRTRGCGDQSLNQQGKGAALGHACATTPRTAARRVREPIMDAAAADAASLERGSSALSNQSSVSSVHSACSDSARSECDEPETDSFRPVAVEEPLPAKDEIQPAEFLSAANGALTALLGAISQATTQGSIYKVIRSGSIDSLLHRLRKVARYSREIKAAIASFKNGNMSYEELAAVVKEHAGFGITNCASAAGAEGAICKARGVSKFQTSTQGQILLRVFLAVAANPRFFAVVSDSLLQTFPRLVNTLGEGARAVGSVPEVDSFPRIGAALQSAGRRMRAVKMGRFTENLSQIERDHVKKSVSGAIASATPVVLGDLALNTVVNPLVSSLTNSDIDFSSHTIMWSALMHYSFNMIYMGISELSSGHPVQGVLKITFGCALLGWSSMQAFLTLNDNHHSMVEVLPMALMGLVFSKFAEAVVDVIEQPVSTAIDASLNGLAVIAGDEQFSDLRPIVEEEMPEADITALRGSKRD